MDMSASARRCYGPLALAALVAFALSSACAQDPKSPAYKLAMNNLSHEYVYCSAYYSIGAHCVGDAKSNDLAQKLTQISKEELERAFILGNEAGLTPEELTARVRTAMTEEMSSVNKDCANISILNQKYAQRCKALNEDEKAAFKVYYEKALLQFPE